MGTCASSPIWAYLRDSELRNQEGDALGPSSPRKAPQACARSVELFDIFKLQMLQFCKSRRLRGTMGYLSSPCIKVYPHGTKWLRSCLFRGGPSTMLKPRLLCATWKDTDDSESRDAGGPHKGIARCRMGCRPLTLCIWLTRRMCWSARSLSALKLVTIGPQERR
ncbi:hypothetical protein L210DRAFT_950586 [Boletus edulis BED1]|uniref:Uncharacterized protein n=1 Tax=Boletus edulis BED1 TaxID=1328754 RepID=A0AAD4GAU3_BOLED|nr:hypothetical protein L210DRAFT_950586 [Boletus edulis BED1]